MQVFLYRDQYLLKYPALMVNHHTNSHYPVSILTMGIYRCVRAPRTCAPTAVTFNQTGLYGHIHDPTDLSIPLNTECPDISTMPGHSVRYLYSNLLDQHHTTRLYHLTLPSSFAITRYRYVPEASNEPSSSTVRFDPASID